MDILVIDVGGTQVKLIASGMEIDEHVSFDSGPELTPHTLVDEVHKLTQRWKYDVISLGFPGRVGQQGPEAEPGNLGPGWVGFDFEDAFHKPTRVVNDAALQALGGYREGRMLFLGLGTGLGSALVSERVIIPLELGDLRYGPDETMADRLGVRGLEKYGLIGWRAVLIDVTAEFRRAFRVDEILLGGGNAERLQPPPPGCRRGGNQDAFAGGFRLWDEWVEGHNLTPTGAWRVVR